MNTTKVGLSAQITAVKFLKSCGYRVVDQNYRTRVCEIDVIALKGNIVFFIEVKYRRNSEYGGGIEAITPRKLSQMKFAARVWNSENKYEGDYRLVAVEVVGPDYSEISVFEL